MSAIPKDMKEVQIKLRAGEDLTIEDRAFTCGYLTALMEFQSAYRRLADVIYDEDEDEDEDDESNPTEKEN